MHGCFGGSLAAGFGDLAGRADWQCDAEAFYFPVGVNGDASAEIEGLIADIHLHIRILYVSVPDGERRRVNRYCIAR